MRGVTVVVERCVVVAVRLEAATMAEADAAFADLGTRIRFTLPKRKFGPALIVWRRIDLHAISRTAKAWRVGGHLATVHEASC